MFVLNFFVTIFLSMLLTCCLVAGGLLALGLLPAKAKELFRIMVIDALTSISGTSFAVPVNNDLIVWYARGNVRFQNGQLRDESDLKAQWERSRRSLRYLVMAARNTKHSNA